MRTHISAKGTTAQKSILKLAVQSQAHARLIRVPPTMSTAMMLRSAIALLQIAITKPTEGKPILTFVVWQKAPAAPLHAPLVIFTGIRTHFAVAMLVTPMT
jgi:hypothetical protein